jgi:hypothetical protein
MHFLEGRVSTLDIILVHHLTDQVFSGSMRGFGQGRGGETS